MFRNTLTANDKYPVRDSENLSSPIQMKLSLKPKAFPDFFPYFWNLHQILSILMKKIILIATLFRELQTLKDLVRQLFNKNRLRTPFVSPHVKGCQALVKSP